jgi:hypothetical protein
MSERYDAVALLSGGLDSILAVKVIEEQGLRVKCLHFVSPFFGKPGKVAHWQDIHGLDIDVADVGEDFARLLVARPAHGFGKILNPCVDCKVLLATRARERMGDYGASFIISGEVLGQRPMSQRRDTLNIIRRDAGVKELLLRPLSAKRLDPTPMEESGLVDRERLHSIGGRGRKEQLALAEKYALQEIPTPAGGCRLAEMESARRYWPVLRHGDPATAADFYLADIGRQYWSGPHWLVIGRDKRDNQRLEPLVGPRDLVFKLRDFPGPLAVARQLAGAWGPEAVKDAALFVARFSPKARRHGGPVEVRVALGSLDSDAAGAVTVHLDRENALAWQEPSWEDALEEKNAEKQAE